MADRKDFIAIFKAEIEDRLTKMDRCLVALEKKSDDIELIKELNREAHTIKGAARVMGYNDIQEIAHKIEDIFDQAIQKSSIFTPVLASKIFRALDAIRAVLGKVLKNEPVDIDVAAVVRDLALCEEGPPPHVPAEPSPAGNEEKAGEAVHASTPASQPAAFDEYIRVPVARVNKILNLAGEMVISKMKSPQRITQVKRFHRLIRETERRLSDLHEKAKGATKDTEFLNLLSFCQAEISRLEDDAVILSDDISSEAFRLDPTIEELQNRVKELRMLPCSAVFEGLPRMIRDIALQEHKEVDFVVEGEETEVDRKVLEKIKTPLMHILRNCIDHGIEEPAKRQAHGKPRQGTIKIHAFHEAGDVVVEIEDDGRGVDLEEVKATALRKRLVSREELMVMGDNEILNIIFMNGFSTSPLITDVSGRGIGLDVARRDIEALKGHVILETQKGIGTKFRLVLPLTIAIIQVLLVKVRGMLFAFPMLSVERTVSILPEDIATIEGKMAIDVLGRTVPIVRLDEVLQFPAAERDREKDAAGDLFVVIAVTLDKWIGFIVDEIIGEEEVFIKSLGDHLGKIANIGGATILGRGEIVVIVDVADLAAHSRLAHPAALSRKFPDISPKKKRVVLVVDDTMTTRELEKSILEARGYVVDVSVDGLDAMEKLAGHAYDLVVTDIQMPRMDGFELCKNIKNSKEHAETPVVMVTALEKEEDKRRGIDAGADAYIMKSTFNQTNLLETIARLLGS